MKARLAPLGRLLARLAPFGWALLAGGLLLSLAERTDAQGMTVAGVLLLLVGTASYGLGRRHRPAIDETKIIAVTTAEPYVRTTLPKDTPAETVLLVMGQAARNMAEAER